MSKFRVRIVEQLSRIIEVEADSIESAHQNVRDQYRKGEIVLNAEDFDSVDFF